MGRKRSALSWGIAAQVLFGFILIYGARISLGYTNPVDVAAINNLYAALESPLLPGWVPVGGDPCGDSWQGVQCEDANINSIILNGANLGGELGDNLGSFSSITAIDLSNNRIGGNIPSNLPVTMGVLFLSDNMFIGSIPTSLSSVTQLRAMSLNNNQLSGEIPDAFQGLVQLTNLDVSSNNLSGELPLSMGSLPSLVTLNLQNNQLYGSLDVLQDISTLEDLNIENNQFSGPIPEKLLSLPNFIKDGNPFNTSTAPLPPPTNSTLPPPAPPFWVPSGNQTPPPPTNETPSKHADGASGREESSKFRPAKKFLTTTRIVWISIAALLLLIILILSVLFFSPRSCSGNQEGDRMSKSHEITPSRNGSLLQPVNQTKKVRKAAAVRPKEEQHITEPKRLGRTTMPEDHKIEMSRFDIYSIAPPPPPPLPPSPPPPPPVNLPFEKVIVKPIVPPTSVKSYTIASLQQYTNSFSQENRIGSGMLGSVYRARLPDGKLLAVKKLDRRISSHQKDAEFLTLVNTLDKIRHANVVQLMGYCVEHNQRLLIYEYCGNGTLQDALHSDDEFKKKLSWNTRTMIALGIARALEYLHEVCEPPIIHRNLKSANVLLDDDLAVHISDCGLAPLIASGSVSQLSGHILSTYGYGAPEFESGIYTSMSDVYSFGVVMLELLTGRKSHDRTRNRGEQFLVRWAMPQLHDIDALSKMVDPSLGGEYPAKSLSNFADIISRCVQAEPEFRPPMSEVVQDLQQMISKESSKRSIGN